MIDTCHDCGASEGRLHELGCDMERCPFCGYQLISCGCCYVQLGFDYDVYHRTCGLPVEIYESGLPDELHEKWVGILNERGRIPYIVYPTVCAKCGSLWPELFVVSDDEWNFYIQPNMRDKVICRKCYDYIKRVIDEGLSSTC